MRRLALLAAVGAAVAAPQAARADGDPASDYLLVQRVFVSYELAPFPQQERALAKEVATVNKGRFRIRVAVIASAYDLGSVTVLWRKPQTYAKFLSAELSFVYKQRLLVVMPNGFGFNWPKHSTSAERALLAKIAMKDGGAGLLEGATAAVQALVKAR